MALTLPPFWTSLEGCDDAEFYDTPAEGAAYAERVRADAAGKLERKKGVDVDVDVGADADWRTGQSGQTQVGTDGHDNDINGNSTRAGGMTTVQSPSPSHSRASISFPAFPPLSPFVQSATANPQHTRSAPVVDFDHSFLPSFHPSHIQHFSTPLARALPPDSDSGQRARTAETSTRADDLSANVDGTGNAHANTAASTTTNANAIAGPGPSTLAIAIASRSRAKFSKVVSAPVLARPSAARVDSDTKRARGSPRRARDDTAQDNGARIEPQPQPQLQLRLGMGRRRLVSGLAPISPSRASAAETSLAEVSVAPTVEEAPSRTHIMTTPVPSRSRGLAPTKEHSGLGLGLGKAGTVHMHIDIPMTGDITHTPVVASPIDTPGPDDTHFGRPGQAGTTTTSPAARSASTSASTGEVAITPLGNAKLRAGKSFLSLTKHFEVFTKALNKPEKSAVRGRPALGKGASGLTPAVGVGGAGAQSRKVSGDKGVLGGAGGVREKEKEAGDRVLERTGTVVAAPAEGVDGVLAGCRFCIPPDHGGLSKHKHRWDIVSCLAPYSLLLHGLMPRE